jgi:alkanesulfonate monooxygenase SsuD/methylene tetrahydromethanopterin reductase-like flavin-dependent oxidoreductase (luciferase family)
MVAPDEFRRLSGILDDLLGAAGRPPGAVRRTLMTNITFAPDRQTLASKLKLAGADAGSAALEEAVASMRASRQNIVGTPEMIHEQIGAYAGAGVEELMLQWLDLDDIEGLRAFAHTVLSSL